jgi:response regulator RpfG family c-di-GMP phosphodiesterase
LPVGSEGTQYRASGKVLVMDDEVWLRDVLASMLGRIGFEVTAASTGEEAVELLWLEPTAVGNHFEEHHAAELPPWEIEQRDTLIGHQFAE